jgi:hypothetical protein
MPGARRLRTVVTTEMVATVRAMMTAISART